MSKQIEALKLALEALEGFEPNTFIGSDAELLCHAAITAIREALAEHIPDANKMVEQPKLSDYEPDGMHHNKLQQRPQNCGTGYCSCIECPYEQPAQQEPVAWETFALKFANGKQLSYEKPKDLPKYLDCRPLYTSPPASKPLTDEQIMEMYNEPRSDAEMLEFARAIEAAHNITGETK